MVRIACIGGSTTVAGRSNEETYPALVEAKLRRRFPGLALEVLNLGVSSTTTEYWQARLGRVFGYQPDVIVHYPGVNDISWRALPHYAETHSRRGLVYRSLLLERLFPLPVEDLDPFLEETFATLGEIERECRARGVACVVGSFAAPDPERLHGEKRRHMDYNAEFWMRKFPMRRYATWARIVERYNQLFVRFAGRYHVPHVLLHEKLDDPELFIDVCHFTPAGIERLADAFLPELEELVRGTPAGRRWQSARAAGPGNGGSARAPRQ